MAHYALIAATQNHGPPHILVLGVLAVAIVGWLLYRAATRGKSTDGGARTDRSPVTAPTAAKDPERDRAPDL